MTTFRNIAVAAAFLVTGTIALFWLAYPTYTHRYRLTVTAEVDGKEKSASSVIEARWQAQPASLTGGRPFERKVFGEAVFLDLGREKPLIVTLWEDTARERIRGSKSTVELALHAFGLKSDRTGLAAISSMRGPVSAAIDALPLMVTFDDISTPQSIRAVTPNDFSAIFGPNVQLRSATIEMTDAPITRSIRDKLPWLKSMGPSGLVEEVQGSRHPFFYATSLTGNDPR